MGQGPYEPRPIWAKAHMGQGQYGPGPIWSKAHMGQGPYGPRAPGPRALPCWANTSPKNAPWKKESKLFFFFVFFGNKKDARCPCDHFGGGIAPRSLLCVRKQRFPFLKPKCFCAAKMLFWGEPATGAGGTGGCCRGNRPLVEHQPIPLKNSKNPKGKSGWGKILS